MRISVTALLSLSLIMLAACASTGPRHGSDTIQLRASAINEKCFQMLPADTLEYSFSSTGPLDFNIHFHESGVVNYPIKKDGVESDTGTYSAAIKQYYCLMWTNPDDDRSIDLSYEFSVMRAGSE